MKDKPELGIKLLSRGVIFLICAFFIIFFTISYNVNSPKKAESLKEILIETGGRVLPENEGKLVIVTATPELLNDGKIYDEEFGVQLQNAFSYNREAHQRVYYLAEKEVVYDKGDINDPYDDKKRTEHYISTHWILASSDRDAVVSWGSKKRENPKKTKLTYYAQGNNFGVGEYEMSYFELRDVIQKEDRNLSKQEFEEYFGEWIKKSLYDFQIVEKENGGAYLSTGDDIGDIHIDITYSVPTDVKEVTVIGKQVGNKIENYEVDGIREYHVFEGTITKEQFIEDRIKTDAGDRKVCIVILSISWTVLIITFISAFVMDF